MGMIKDIYMLETVTGDRYGVIRDYVFDRSENGEYFFVISTPNKTEAVYIDSPQTLCEYLNISKVAKNRGQMPTTGQQPPQMQ